MACPKSTTASGNSTRASRGESNVTAAELRAFRGRLEAIRNGTRRV